MSIAHTTQSLHHTLALPLALISLQVERKNVRYLGGRWDKWHNNKPITGTHQSASGWWFSPELHHKLCLRHCCCRTWWWWQCESLTELSTNNNRLKIQINSHQPLSWINVDLFDHNDGRSDRCFGWHYKAISTSTKLLNIDVSKGVLTSLSTPLLTSMFSS